MRAAASPPPLEKMSVSFPQCGQTQRAIVLAEAFAAQGIAKDATRGTLAIDDDLVLNQLRNGQDVTVGLLATNGRREQSNEADAKFTVRLGAAP